MLRNHDLLTADKSAGGAILPTHTFENACRIQIDAQARGELVHVDAKVLQGLAQVLKEVAPPL
jgi:hypothetical protein